MTDSKKPGDLEVAVDHVVVNVLDRLDQARDQYRRLGFHLTTRGHHSLGSSNHLAIFTSNYFELLGYEPGAETRRADLLRAPAGLTGLVFRLPAPDARQRDLQRRGVPIEPAKEFNRPVLLADGPHDARFRVIDVSNGFIPYGRVFFCHHYTPELVWRREDQQHPNAVTDVAALVMESNDPARMAAAYRQMFGDDLVKPEPGGFGFSAGAARVSMLDHEAVKQRFGAAPPPRPDGRDRMVGLVFRTASIEAAKACFIRGDLRYIPSPAGGVTIAPLSETDPILSFVE